MRLAAGCALLLIVGMGPACGDQLPTTEVMVIVDAETAVRLQAETLRIEVTGMADQDGTSRVTPPEVVVTKASGDLRWPYLIALTPLGGDSARTYQVVATGLDASGDLVGQVRANSGFVKHRLLELRLVLEALCAGKQECPSDQTCRGGSCESAHVDPRDLLDFTGRDGTTGEGGRAGGTTVPTAGAGGAGASGGAGGTLVPTAGAGGAGAGAGGAGGAGGGPACDPRCPCGTVQIGPCGCDGMYWFTAPWDSVLCG